MRRILDVVVALGGAAAVTAVGSILFPNETTAVVAFFLFVLGLSVWRGIVAGVAGSLAASACFNYFFIPPVGTFRVADPANWVALGSFLVASSVASRLVGMARRRAEEADARTREVVALAAEREALLEERAHLEALRESDRLKTALLRAVSHDLRSPLTAMRLGVGSLRRLVAAGGSGEVRAALEGIERETERLNRRIDTRLALARLEAGVVKPRPEPTPAADLFRAVREALSTVLSGREPSVRVDPECPEVLVDPGLALEILVNLVENAARASPAGLPVELSAVPHPQVEGRVWLEVLDRGPGIPPGSFEPREAAVLEGTPEGGRGFGLGLQIARGLASACGGVVLLSPRPGGGTVARVDLPAASVTVEDSP